MSATVAINAVTLDDDPTSYTSAGIEVKGDRFFSLAYDIDSTGSPTSVQLQIQLSFDDSTWYDLVDAPFGTLIFDDTQTASGLNEVLNGELGSFNYVRIVATGTGTDASNYFDVTATLSLYGTVAQ